MKFNIYSLKQFAIILVFIFGVSCKNKNGNSQANLDSILVNSSTNELSVKIEKDASNPELYYQRSVVFFNETKLDKALQDIDKAIVFNKQNPLYYYLKTNVEI